MNSLSKGPRCFDNPKKSKSSIGRLAAFFVAVGDLILIARPPNSLSDSFFDSAPEIIVWARSVIASVKQGTLALKKGDFGSLGKNHRCGLFLG